MNNIPSELTTAQFELLKLYIGELMGLKSIGRKICRDPRSFKKEIVDRGINIPFPGSIWRKFKQHMEGEFYRPLPKWLEDVIIGSLLGDGQIRLQSKKPYHMNHPTILEYEKLLEGITKIRLKAKKKHMLTTKEKIYWNKAIERVGNTNTANFRIHKSILEFNWVKHLTQFFSQYFKVRSYIKPSHSNSTQWSCGFDTSSSIQLFTLWRKWYISKEKGHKKIIPNLRQLTPNMLLHWYIGDGYMSGTDLALCTHCFSLEEQKTLISLLASIGVYSKLRCSKTRLYIGISTKKANKENFFNFMNRAKFFKKAQEFFPYKFDSHLPKKKWKEMLFNDHPEYFQRKKNIRAKLLSELHSI